MKNGFRLFDAHTHIGAALHSGRVTTAGDLLRHMDRHGVDRALAIPYPVTASEREAHDQIGRAVLAHPDRFVGAAYLNPFLPEPDFRAELDRALELYGFRALKIQPQYQGLDPLSARAETIFALAAARRLAIVVHTGSGIPFALPSLWMPLAGRFPDTPVILAHCGGGGVYAPEAVVAALFCPNIFLEVGTLAPHHVTGVLARIPPERLMIGSDLTESIEGEFAKVFSLDLDPEAKQAILAGTAERALLGPR